MAIESFELYIEGEINFFQVIHTCTCMYIIGLSDIACVQEATHLSRAPRVTFIHVDMYLPRVPASHRTSYGNPHLVPSVAFDP